MCFYLIAGGNQLCTRIAANIILYCASTDPPCIFVWFTRKTVGCHMPAWCLAAGSYMPCRRAVPSTWNGMHDRAMIWWSDAFKSWRLAKGIHVISWLQVIPTTEDRKKKQQIWETLLGKWKGWRTSVSCYAELQLLSQFMPFDVGKPHAQTACWGSNAFAKMFWETA